jgi:hypothetical protein
MNNTERTTKRDSRTEAKMLRLLVAGVCHTDDWPALYYFYFKRITLVISAGLAAGET